MPYKNCLSVYLPECPVQKSVYGYYPSLAANTIFLVLFMLSALTFLIQGWIKRRADMNFFCGVMTFGTFMEGIGYIGRMLLHQNPYGDSGFKLQIVLLITCPAFFAAGIYFCLAKIVTVYGAHYSRIPPNRLTYIFITCDIISLTLQGTGGGIASGPSPVIGSNIMLAGVSFQVLTLLVFLLVVSEIYINIQRSSESEKNPHTLSLRKSFKFKGFLCAWSISFIAIFWRCSYRIAEMAKGWGNPIMQVEWTFIAFDSCMCVIAVFVLNVFHPAWCLTTGDESQEKEDSEIQLPSKESRESQEAQA